jgi:pyruvyltransferase
MSAKAIKLYWSASKPNVGDWLSPLIVASLTSRPIEHAIAKKSEMMCVGSILHKAKNHWLSPVQDIWGSGYMHDCAPRKSKHRIHAVRGKLTRDRLLNNSAVAVGDPGLLVSTVLAEKASNEKKYTIGIIPHYWDKDDPQVMRFLEKYPQVKFLDVFNDVDTFIAEMTACEFIISSSLHGLIMADAFKIPNQWMVVSDKVEGDNFKFYDYYSVFDMQAPEYSDLDSLTLKKIDSIAADYKRPSLAAVQQAIIDSFPASYK